VETVRAASEIFPIAVLPLKHVNLAKRGGDEALLKAKPETSSTSLLVPG
jgi:hypothetical protein